MDARMNRIIQPLLELYQNNQYFIPEVALRDNEFFIDCGMFDGDTIVDFRKKCKKYGHILAFEPDKDNIVRYKNRMLEEERTTIIAKGVWKEEGCLFFNNMANASSAFSQTGNSLLEVTSIDKTLEKINMNLPVTFIKMDVEGSELMALYGAEKSIVKYQPKLAICVYHKKEDLISIPQYLKSLEQYGVKYKFLLRHHAQRQQETVLYAISEKDLL